jgi:hypothetical protein
MAASWQYLDEDLELVLAYFKEQPKSSVVFFCADVLHSDQGINGLKSIFNVMEGKDDIDELFEEWANNLHNNLHNDEICWEVARKLKKKTLRETIEFCIKIIDDEKVRQNGAGEQRQLTHIDKIFRIGAFAGCLVRVENE